MFGAESDSLQKRVASTPVVRRGLGRARSLRHPRVAHAMR
ncbi:Atypical orf [Ralstonia solanacearum UW551]|uniref:Atypical orf n=1 Tax=Ralstonia solanacearum (strain UW551) TaxID=342110 RepID=A0AB33VBZ3_RALSU|nr:Atypical orf [Ralstonia solanacearum UW551]